MGRGCYVAVVSCGLGVWAAFRAAYPRQELTYEVLGIRPHAAKRTATGSQIIEIRLVNSGQRDIPSDAFDGGKPLRFEVTAATSVQITKCHFTPGRTQSPRVDIRGSILSLGPDLIKRRQVITISLLAGGNVSQVIVAEDPLIGIKVRKRHVAHRTAISHSNGSSLRTANKHRKRSIKLTAYFHAAPWQAAGHWMRQAAPWAAFALILSAIIAALMAAQVELGESLLKAAIVTAGVVVAVAILAFVAFALALIWAATIAMQLWRKLREDFRGWQKRQSRRLMRPYRGSSQVASDQATSEIRSDEP